ncbi:rhamnulokinase family protein [Cohnella sp. GCM10020058]|uniref:rhamnulokinase n=1 Tax=Cohnella sp. GCM10020058 TaxID=3317330 RepID=UPI003633F403
MNIVCADLGASNGRVFVGSFDGQRLTLSEMHRFHHASVALFGHLYWDMMHLYKETAAGLGIASRQFGAPRSIGIDGWSQDFGLLDKQGNLLTVPHSYRDSRTDNMADIVYAGMSEHELFRITGKPPSQVTTLFQLAAMRRTEQAALDHADKLLFIPNLLGYYLTGELNCDSSLASASSLMDIRQRDWSAPIAQAYGLGTLMPAISRPGRIVGETMAHVREAGGTPGIPVVSVAQHDTISALLAADLAARSDAGDAATIVCGTWSVVSVTHDVPIFDDFMLKHGFHNEPAYYGDEVHVLKYMTGMWILQECMKEWSAGGAHWDYERLQAGAQLSRYDSPIDVESEEFSQPGEMREKIVRYCRRTGLPEPQNEIEIFQCIMLGLANKFAETVSQLEQLTGRRLDKIVMVGGGSRSEYLCRLTARLSGLPVYAGMHEASIVGNSIAQLVALGEIGHFKEATDLLDRSFKTVIFPFN